MNADDRESTLKLFGRRSLTITLYSAACVLMIAGLPLLLIVAAATDAFRGRRLVGVRFLLMFVFYLGCEVLGVVAAFFIWSMSGVWAGASRDRYLRWNFALQRWWAGSLFAAGRRIFGLNTEVEMPPDLDRGPFIIFIRHTSIADTLLPATFLSRRYGLRLRYVLKSELIWDPCLDIVGHRLPNCFVKRGAGDSLAVASVQRLMNGLAAGDGVLMYPEGTRFTEDKKLRALDSLSRSADPRLVEKARGFRNVLPPRLGGPLALLERNKSADVLFCAHVGFEGVTNFRDLMRGSMVGALIHVKFWRVPFDEIPDERQSMTNWLFDQWKMVDDWVTEHRAPIQPGR